VLPTALTCNCMAAQWAAESAMPWLLLWHGA
jgi:hypothetical protein